MTYIVCKNLSRRYEKNKVALEKLNVSLDLRGVFALIGRNGAGKTTLIRMLSTNLSPTDGSASIDGFDTIKDAKALRDKIAIVPQEARPVPWMTPMQTIMAYLMWRGIYYGEAKKRATEVIKTLGIEKFADSLNSRLSGGTKRKVLVGTVMASGAEIIFLDEPTTGLDPISRVEMWDVLSKLKKKHFIFLTTHYLEEAEVLADKIGILDNGKLLAVDSLDGLRRKTGYPHSVKLLDKNVKIKVKNGRIVKGSDGYTQVLTTERGARGICTRLIKSGVKFATNPVSLEDIFYYFVKRRLNENGGEENDYEW